MPGSIWSSPTATRTSWRCSVRPRRATGSSTSLARPTSPSTIASATATSISSTPTARAPWRPGITWCSPPPIFPGATRPTRSSASSPASTRRCSTRRSRSWSRPRSSWPSSPRPTPTTTHTDAVDSGRGAPRRTRGTTGHPRAGAQVLLLRRHLRCGRLVPRDPERWSAPGGGAAGRAGRRRVRVLLHALAPARGGSGPGGRGARGRGGAVLSRTPHPAGQLTHQQQPATVGDARGRRAVPPGARRMEAARRRHPDALGARTQLRDRPGRQCCARS